MNSKKFFDKIETMEDKDIMSFISASIEYLIYARDCDFNKIIRQLKKCHKFVVKMNRSEE